MAVDIGDIRALLLPGLYDVTNISPAMWNSAFAVQRIEPITFPAIGPRAALAIGAAAAIMTNPPVSRRSLLAWLRS